MSCFFNSFSEAEKEHNCLHPVERSTHPWSPSAQFYVYFVTITTVLMKQYCFSYLNICYALTGSQLLPTVLQQCNRRTSIGCSAWRELEWIYFKYLHRRVGLSDSRHFVVFIWILADEKDGSSTNETQSRAIVPHTTLLHGYHPDNTACYILLPSVSTTATGLLSAPQKSTQPLGYIIACVAFFGSFRSVVP